MDYYNTAAFVAYNYSSTRQLFFDSLGNLAFGSWRISNYNKGDFNSLAIWNTNYTRIFIQSHHLKRLCEHKPHWQEYR